MRACSRARPGSGREVGRGGEGGVFPSASLLGRGVELNDGGRGRRCRGPEGKWNRERTAVRDGHEDGEVTLGGRGGEVRRGGCGPPTASTRWRCRPTSISLIATRCQGAARADARGRVDPGSTHAGAGRRGGRDPGAVDVEVGGVTDVRRAHPDRTQRALSAPARGSAFLR